MTEKQLMTRVLKVLGGNPLFRLFRNNVGRFLTEDGRRIQTGLCKGSSDIIGFKKIKITPEMVGGHFAVFTAIEVKSETGKLTKDQSNFLQMVSDSGGVALIVDNEECLSDGFSKAIKEIDSGTCVWI